MGNSHSKTQLKTAVAQRRWSDAFSLLADSSYSNSAVEHFIKYCDKYGLDSEFSLADINTEERDILLKTAVRVTQWNVVHHVLEAGVNHETCVWVIEEACKTASYKNFTDYILPQVDSNFLHQCSTEQLDILLTTATTNRRWNFVKKLCAGGSHSQRLQIIEHACKTADYTDFQNFILEYVDDDVLSQCSTEQLDTLLTTATTRGLWHMVHSVLRVVDSHDKRVWVIDQACTTAEYSHFDYYILSYVDNDFISHCNTQQLDTLLTTATTRGLWSMVCKVLKVVDNHEKRVWVVDQACKTAEYDDFDHYILPNVDNDFLSRCNADQTDTLLTTATTNGWWYVDKMFLRAAGSHSQRIQIIQHACKTADYILFQAQYVEDDFLSQCSTEQLNTLLTTATTNGRWKFVNMLCAGGSHSQRIQIINHAFKTADDWHFQNFILEYVNNDFLSHYSTEQLDTLLTTATTRGLWSLVHKLLETVNSHEKRVWVIEQAGKTADYMDLKDNILPHLDGDFLSHCSTEQLDTFLTTATTRGIWHMVHIVMKAGGSQETRVWVTNQACRRAVYMNFEDYILPHVDNHFLSQCSIEQLDTLLTTATTNGRWYFVKMLLHAGGSHSQRLQIIEHACKTAYFKDFEENILPHIDDDFLSNCSTEQLDTLMTTATTRGLFHMIHKALKVVGSHKNLVWVIEQACKSADYHNFKNYILPYIDDDFLPHCSKEQLDTYLTTATTNGRWYFVKMLLHAGGSHSQRLQIIKHACKTAYFKDFEENILEYVDGDFLSHCRTEQLNTLLTTATTRDLWHMVHKVLKTGVNHEKHIWVIKQACTTASYKDFEDYMLPHIDDDFLSHCSTEQLDTLMTTATARGLFHMIHKVLKVVGSHKNLVWVIEQACKSADYNNFKDYILPYIDDDFLSHCSKEQLDTFLTTATTNGRWYFVKMLLHAGRSHSQRLQIIKHTCKTADFKDFEENILEYVDDDFLSHCSTEQLDSLLTTATTRGLFHMVHKVLKVVGSHKERVWVIDQACKSADYKNFKDYILPYLDDTFLSHCSKEQLDTFLTTATTNGRWYFVKMLLHAGGSHSQRLQIIKHACKTAFFEDFEAYILEYVDDDFLSHCSTEQMNTLLTTATTRRLFHMAQKMLETVGSHENRLWVIEEACKTGIYRDFKRYVQPNVDNDFLSQCSSEQLDTLMKTAITQGLYQMVHKVLEICGSHEKRVWFMEQACKSANRNDLEDYILPQVDDAFLSQCSTEQLDTLLTIAILKQRWYVVDALFHASASYSLRVRVIEQACKKVNFSECRKFILDYVDDDLLCHWTREHLDTFFTTVTTQGLWHLVNKVLEIVSNHDKRVRVIEEACKTADNKDFEDYILPHVDSHFLSHCSTDKLNTLLTTAVPRGLWHMVHKVLEAGGSHEHHEWVVQQACKSANNKDFEDYILPHVDSHFLSHCSTDKLETLLLTRRFRGKRFVGAKSRMWALTEACKGFTYATVMRNINIAFGITNVQLLISSLPSKQLSRDSQSVALRFALQEHKWDVISRASLSQVWEQVRRHLFREAVYQRQWIDVKKWADHTLFDDERWWALEESYKQKQWDVMLELADHGLTEIELMRVRYRLAKHADWDVVLRMCERGVDVTEVREMVETVMLSRKAKADEEKHCALVDRWWQLRQLEEKLIHASATRITLPSTAAQWESVLFHLHRHPGTVSVRSRSQPSKTFSGLLLKRAIKQRAWHVVMHLVTLGMDTSQLDSLLTDMIRRHQWGVCRVLLEQGVSVQSCLNSLFVFMEKNKWMLVARVIEFIVDDSLKHQVEQLALDRRVGSLVWQCVSAMCRYGMCVGDALRLNVMHRAMERREGSVVGECINTMEHYRLSAKEREELFQKAISHGILQAVKPLVEHKDETGIQHRDTAMLAAIEQRQWDVVDCCQLQGADIDIKDKHGETSLIREAWNSEWKAVEELVVRGADPNVLDKIDNCSVLYKAIRAKQWDIVRLLIEYHADIHKAAPLKPLHMLIDERQGEIIHHTLIWCPDQAKGVNHRGETTLHAIALDKRPELLYYQIVRGVSPLTLTKEGHSVLLYAVRNEPCPQKMVAECIRLGFGTHQPPLTWWKMVDMVDYVTDSLLNEIEWKMQGYERVLTSRRVTSPFLLALLCDMPVVAHMLYESGSCSYTELLHVYTVLLDLSDPYTEDGRTLLEGYHTYLSRQRYDSFVENITTFLPYLREMATTPRSLVSTCRLLISQCLTVRGRRERAVQDLFMTDRMKNYLLFSDLTDPDYQPSMYGRCHHTELRNRKELELEQWMKKTFDEILKELEGTDPSEVHLSANNASTQRDSV